MRRTLIVLLAGFLVFALINAALDQTAQAAPRAQEIDLPTPSPTPEIVDTPSATSTPPASELPTATGTFEPVISLPTGTDTPTLPLLTDTPTPELADLSLVTLTVSHPELVYPGTALSITWHIELWERIAGFSPELWLTLPAGFEPSGQVVLPLSSAEGSLEIKVGEEARGPFPITAELHAGGQAVMQISRELPEGNRSEIGPEGGEATGMDGRVRVYFPAEALQGVTADNPLIVRIRPPRSSAGAPYYLSGMPFELVAEQQPDGLDAAILPVTQFATDVVVTVSYTDEQVAELDEAALFLYTYDPAYESWTPVRSRVDVGNNTLTAWVSHFSLYDVNAQDWEAARLPGMAAFQTAGFTGAATYAFPIQVPAGPGGLQPSLNLSYNSQVVDSANGNTQASWVGMGWSLDTGYIQRNMHGSMTWLDDDTFSLSANGVGGMLLKGMDGYYHTTDESFWRIQYYPPQSGPGTDYWIAWDKVGNEYYFGIEDSDRAHYPNLDPVLCPDHDGDPVTWRWALSKIRNIYGQELIFNYSVASKWVGSDICGEMRNYGVDLDIYPFEIRYPNLRYRVRFESTTGRLDFDHEWDTPYSYIFYQRSQLNRIAIQHDPDGDGDFSNAELVRSYNLVYASSGQTIFPNYTWTEGGKTLTLVEIHEHGEGGAGPLPATTFTYGDGMHLTYAANGSGGWVAYSYTAWSEVDAADSATLEQHFGALYNPCYYADNEGGWSGNNVSCVEKEGLAVQGTAYRAIDPGMWHPGGTYQIYARLIAYDSNGDNLYLGLWDGAASTLEPAPPGAPISHWEYTPVTVTVQLPATAYRLSKFLIQVTNSLISDYRAQRLPTYYRVTAQTVGDLVTGAEYSTEYNYDEPATNDAQHSYAVAVTDPYWIYTDAYTEFRGHAMTRIKSQDDQVTTTFYAQDDARSGRAQTVITGREEFADDFDGESIDSGWIYDPASASLARLRGDAALKLTGGGSYASLSRQYATLTGSQSVLVQFQTSGESNDIILGIETGQDSSYLRYGIHVRDDGSLWTHYCSASGCVDEIQMIGAGGIARDTWYVLLLIVDDHHNFQLRVWQRDDPSVVFRRTRSLGSGLCWRSIAQSMNGVLWLDAYSEEYLNTLSDSLYDADSNAPVGVDPTALPRDVKPPHPTNTELTITWARVIQSKQLSFGGDAQFVGARSMYEYDTYGNVTRVTESDWDPVGQFRDFRLTQTGYAINTTGVYLVGLPAYVSRYTCRYNNAYQANGACSTSYPGWLPTAWLASSDWYLYDEHTTWNEPPLQGIFTGQRQLLRFASPITFTDPMYADTQYVYDDFGNQTGVYVYEQENSASQFAYGAARHTATCYETFDRLTGACTDNGYHTYPSGATNALGHRVRIAYDPIQGLPVAIEDANGNTTTAAYDAYGRMIEIRRPGDSLPGQATVQIIYHLASAPYPANPFYTEFLQKIDGLSTYRVNKYYSGLGQLIQSEVHGAMLGETARDLLVDIFYDLLGRAAQQSMPYDRAPSSVFQGRLGTYFSLTTYDLFGRTGTMSAPDGSNVSYDYGDGFNGTDPYIEVQSTDANGNITLTHRDLWGRTVWVNPPDGPSVSYTYDAAGRLVKTTYGTAETTLDYDLAGRKTQMIDPDMGTWSYAYNALGELVRQTDARGQRICMYYDGLGRLTGKHYRADDTCPSTPTLNVSYTYDQGTNGVGQRTRMDDGSGFTTWSYDSRGRVTEVYQSVTGGGNFRTQWGYNSADLPVWMRYPLDNGGNLGETVNFTYNTQMLLDRVYGTSTYVDDTSYDAAGRVTLRELGNSYTLGQTYTYYPWTQQGGRLQSLQSGIPADQDSLQSLSYYYDDVGNVETISDYHATSNPSDPQVQSFGYDMLDRLINAQATNGETYGRYPQQSYDYNDTTGNMETNAGMSYAYTYPNAPAGVAPVHGVRQVTGGTVYNGTVTVRARATGCTTSPVMKLYVNGTLRQQWTVRKTSYIDYSVTTGVTADAQVDVVFSNAYSGCTLQVDYVIIPTATGARTVQAESTGTVFDRGAETGAPGANTFDGVNVANGAELMTETGSLRFVVGLKALASGYDANGNMILRLKDGARYFLSYDSENRLTSVSGTVSASFTYNGDGQQVTATFGATITTYIGGYFEWQSGVGKSYYFTGAQRVAMRTGAGVEFLLGDHLGSTSLTVNSIGGNPRELRYYPWGEVRWASGTTPTDYRFTGQQELSSIGLYNYGARFYDPALGRFAQSDSIIPNPSYPVAWDRYAYTANNPVKYIDPSGHGYCSNPAYVPDNECAELDPNGDGVINLFPTISLDTIPDIGHRDEVFYQYLLTRQWLYDNYGMEFIDPRTGKIDDQVILAIIAAGEFGDFEQNSAIYGEALEALSREYYSEEGIVQTPCLGNCTIEEQLIWLQIEESFYSGRSYEEIVQNGDRWWQDHNASAAQAMRNDYRYGLFRESWIWGNVDPGSQMMIWINSGEDTRYVYAVGDFVVLTAYQNNQMRSNGWHNAPGGYWYP